MADQLQTPKPGSGSAGAGGSGKPAAGAAGNAPKPSGGPNRMPPVDQLRDRPLGRVLIKMGRLTREQVHQALAVQNEQRAKKINTPIGQVLVEMGLITQKDLNIALAAQRGYEVVDLGNREIPPDVLKLIPPQMASVYRVLPLAYNASTNNITIALDSPDNFRVVDDLKTLMGYKVTACIADSDSLAKMLHRYYAIRSFRQKWLEARRRASLRAVPPP